MSSHPIIDIKNGALNKLRWNVKLQGIETQLNRAINLNDCTMAPRSMCVQIY